MPSFNLYLDEERVRDELADELKLEQISNFASSYYVATRVCKPLLARPRRSRDRRRRSRRRVQPLGRAVAAAGDYGTQKLFVFRKLG